MRTLLLILSVAVAIALPVAAQQGVYWGDRHDDLTSGADFQRSKAECRRVRDLRPPPADVPNARQRRDLKGCVSEVLYYGIGTPAKPAEARQCAMTAPLDTGDPFDGAGMLATVYANGHGAARNLDLAMHYACLMDGAPYEMVGRIEHLEKIKAGTASAGEFGVCDDVTSGLLGGICASHDEDLLNVKRNARIARLTSGFTSDQRDAFARLRYARDAYADATSANEVDRSGTARNALEMERLGEVRDDFLKRFTALEAGDPPHPGRSFATADARLNTYYRRIMAKPDIDAGTVTRDGVRKAERAWLPYRDAWAAFARMRYPQIDADALKASLTAERADFLKDFGEPSGCAPARSCDQS